jgi:hypothetical protein
MAEVGRTRAFWFYPVDGNPVANCEGGEKRVIFDSA